MHMDLRDRQKVNYKTLHTGVHSELHEFHLDTVNIDMEPTNGDGVEFSQEEVETSIREAEDQLKQLELQEKKLQVEYMVAQKQQQVNDLQSNIASLAKNNVPPVVSVGRSQPVLVPNIPVDPTLKSMAADPELTAALEVLKSSHLNDLLSVEGAEGPAVSTSSSKGTLYITDFVKKPESNCRETERHLGRGLWIRDAKQKVKLEDVTEAQWAGANARILLALLDQMDKSELESYLQYSATIADYFQVCEVPSVLILDEEHRVTVAREGRDWKDIDQTKAFFYLKKRENASQQKSNARTGKRFPGTEEKKPICYDYNSEAGCQRRQCNFSHTCTVIGCNASHPRFQHNVAPRFRTPVANQA